MPTKAGQGLLDTNHGQGLAMETMQGLTMISFVNPQPGPDLAARIQDGDLISTLNPAQT